MKVWFPVIRGNSGTDVFTRRMVDALQRYGILAEITWFPSCYELAPFLLKGARPPEGTTVIHANTWNGFAFKRDDIPLIVTEHLNVFDPRYALYKTIAQRAYHELLVRPRERASFRAATVVTCVSQDTAASVASTIMPQRPRVIPTWVDGSFFKPDSSEPTCATHHPFRLLFVGNPTRRKGADLLPAIMNELGTDFVLHFTSGLRDLKGMKLTANMEPLGRITNLYRLREMYCDADALLFPSRLEGLSLVILEAMACGKPVIAANISSMPETVIDGVTGMLCPPDNVNSFVSACRRLSTDPMLAYALGKAARERTIRLFDESVVVPQYISLYHEVNGDG